jgi:hypothetical protein
LVAKYIRSNLAMVLYYAKDYVQALDHQQKAVIINERVLGMDHHDTAHSYVSVRSVWKF